MGKSFNVLIFNEHRFPSAVFRYGLDISHATDGQSRYVNIVYNRKAWPLEYEPICAFGKFHHASLNYLFRNFCFSDIIETARKEHTDGGIIHYASINVTPFLSTSERCVVTVHDNPVPLLSSDLYHEDKTGIIERVIRKSYQHRLRMNVAKFSEFHNIIAVSEYVRQSLLSYGFTGGVKVISPPVSPSFCHIEDKKGLRKKLNLPLDKKLILSVSTLAKKKNLGMVHKTLESLGGDYKLVRLGPPLGNSLTFSNVDMNTVNEIYNACDVLLLPSLEEGFGYPVVEAFSTGLPVVASDIDVMREVARKAAIFVNPSEADSVVDGVITAIHEHDRLVDLGFQESRRFSFESFAGKMADYYSNISTG